MWWKFQNSTQFSFKSNFTMMPQDGKRHWSFSQLSVTTQLSSVVLVADNWFKLKRHLMASISISNCRAKLWWFFIPVALLYDHTTVQWKESKWTRLKFGVQYTVTCVEKQFHTWPPCSTEVGSAPLIHFQKLFWNKVFYILKLVREFKFHIWMTISGSKSVKKSQTFLKKATN